MFERIGSAVRALVAPAPVVRASATAARTGGGLDGAVARRRLVAWNATTENINSLIMNGGDMLRARCRALIRSNGYAASACDSFATNAVGCGIKPSSLIEDPALRKQWHRLWKRWTDQADADDQTDFYGMQLTVARGLFEAGEVFVRFRPRRTEDVDATGRKLRIPVQVQLIEPEHCPVTKNETAPNGNKIRCGIEFDLLGRRVAYWMYRRHPGDGTQQASDNQLVRVPASEICHVFKPLRPGQIRGLPFAAPVVVKLFLLDQYDDAMLDRAKVAALFAGFITKDAPEPTFSGEEDSDEADEDESVGIAPMEPGSLQVLLPGEDIKFSAPADAGSSYDVFIYRNLLAVCAGLGLPYMNVTGDLKSANYSSMRAGQLEMRRRMAPFQHGTLVYQLCRPVYYRVMDAAALAGVIDFPDYARDSDPYTDANWVPDRWDWVDPSKDVKAERDAVDALFKPRSAVQQAMGFDPEETDEQIAADKKRADRLKIAPKKAAPVAASAAPEDQEPGDKQPEDQEQKEPAQ